MSEKEITYLAFHGFRWTCALVIFIIIFSHVWTRKGYEGHDGILDLLEVDKFFTHIISAGSYLTLDAMAIWEPIIGHETSWEWKAVFAGGFLGSGAYIILAGFKRRLIDHNKQ
jgi:hypothetical protein